MPCLRLRTLELISKRIPFGSLFESTKIFLVEAFGSCASSGLNLLPVWILFPDHFDKKEVDNCCNETHLHVSVFQEPICLKKGDNLTVHFWRMCTNKNIWYEWCVTEPYVRPLHNPKGRSYTIGL